MRAPVPRSVQQGVQLGQLGGAAAEAGDVRGQLGGDAGRRFRGGEVLSQHLALGRAQLGAGFDAQLAVQPPPDLFEHRQRGRLPPGRGEHLHQPGVRGLVQRLFGGEHAQLHRGVLGVRGPGVRHDRLRALHRQGQPGGVLPEPSDVGERRAAPEFQGLAVGALGASERFEVQEIEVVLAGGQPVAALVGGDEVGGPQRPPQPRDVGVEEVQARRRRLVPDDVDEVLAPDGAVRLQGQHREQQALLLGADLDRGVPAPHGERPQDADPHPLRRCFGKRFPQPAFGLRPGPADAAELGVAHRAQAQPGALGQLGLGEAGEHAPFPQPSGERQAFVHRRPFPACPAAERTPPAFRSCRYTCTTERRR